MTGFGQDSDRERVYRGRLRRPPGEAGDLQTPGAISSNRRTTDGYARLRQLNSKDKAKTNSHGSPAQSPAARGAARAPARRVRRAPARRPRRRRRTDLRDVQRARAVRRRRFATRSRSCGRASGREGRTHRRLPQAARSAAGATTSPASTSCSRTSPRTPPRSRACSPRCRKGDLSQTIDVEGKDTPLRGDFLRHAQARQRHGRRSWRAFSLRGDPRRPGGRRRRQARRAGARCAACPASGRS